MKWYSALAAAFVGAYVFYGVAGCDVFLAKPANAQVSVEKKNYFNSFGEVFRNGHSRYNADQIRLGDMDGDGDLDIVLTESGTGIVSVLENRIPQKNKK